MYFVPEMMFITDTSKEASSKAYMTSTREKFEAHAASGRATRDREVKTLTRLAARHDAVDNTGGFGAHESSPNARRVYHKKSLSSPDVLQAIMKQAHSRPISSPMNLEEAQVMLKAVSQHQSWLSQDVDDLMQRMTKLHAKWDVLVSTSPAVGKRQMTLIQAAQYLRKMYQSNKTLIESVGLGLPEPPAAYLTRLLVTMYPSLSDTAISSATRIVDEYCTLLDREDQLLSSLCVVNKHEARLNDATDTYNDVLCESESDVFKLPSNSSSRQPSTEPDLEGRAPPPPCNSSSSSFVSDSPLLHFNEKPPSHVQYATAIRRC